jgi:hypothetical protein
MFDVDLKMEVGNVFIRNFTCKFDFVLGVSLFFINLVCNLYSK